MILYFFDRHWNPLGKASSKLPNSVFFYDDKEVEDVESGTSTFEVYIGFDNGNRNLVQAYGDDGNYIVTKTEADITKIWTIIDDESDEAGMYHYFYAEDAGMDLLNETLPAWGSPGKAQPVKYYVEKAVYDSGFEIGNNEISNLTRTLHWDDEATALNRLQSILTQFDNAELKIRFEIDEYTMELEHKYIDILKRRGTDTGEILKINHEVENIRMKRSRANLVNAYRATGTIPEGKDKPIDLNGYKLTTEQQHINPETGKPRFKIMNSTVLDTESNAKYSRYLNPNDQGEDEGYYTANYTGEANSQKTLADEVITKLKKTSEPEVNFEVDVVDPFKTLKVGDTVNIVNDDDELYLEARLLQTERSRANDTFVITLGDYLIKDSGISDQLQAMADKLKGKDGENGKDAVLLTISSVNGNIFKNTGVSTVLVVTVIVGEMRIETSEELKNVFGSSAFLQWQIKKVGELEFTDIPKDDEHLSDDGFLFKVGVEDIEAKATFNCILDY